MSNMIRFLFFVTLASCTLSEDPGDGPDAGNVGVSDIEIGDFEPTFDTPNPHGIVYLARSGSYIRLGDWVHVSFLIEYENTDVSQGEEIVRIIPPYVPEMDANPFQAYTGSIDTYLSNFGVQGAGFASAHTSLHGASTGLFIRVRGRGASMADPRVELRLGSDNTEKAVVGEIAYRTTGVRN
jgi:hypothetical protein